MTNDVPAMPYGPRSHAPHRAALRRLGLSVSVAIALGGCTPPRHTNEDAGDTAFSTITMMLDSSHQNEILAARAALQDGRLTTAEYNQVIAISDANKRKACSLAREAAAEAARGERLQEDVPDIRDTCEFGIIFTDKGIYLPPEWSRFAAGLPPASAMSAGTAETQSGSGPQDRQRDPQGDAQNNVQTPSGGTN